MFDKKLKNKRSSSLSSIIQNNASVYDVLEVNRSRFFDSQKKMKQAYSMLKSYNNTRNDNKQNKLITIKQDDYQLLLNNIKFSLQKIAKMNNDYQELCRKLEQENNKLKEIKDKEIRSITLRHQEETKFNESEYNKNLMTMNSQFSKKQQYYKQLFTNFVESLNQAQRIWTVSFSSIQDKCRNLAQFILKNLEYQNKNKDFYEEIIELVNQLNLRKEINDSIISRRSEDYSCIQFSPVMKKNSNKAFKFQEKKNTIDMSEIEPIQEQEQQQLDLQSRQIQNALRLLVSIGFFSRENYQYAQKMFAVTATLDKQYTQLLNQPIYPLMVEFLKNNYINREQDQRSVENQIIEQQQSVSFHSPLPSNRDNTEESIISRHLDIDQLIQNQGQQQKKLNESIFNKQKLETSKNFLKKRL